MQFSSAILLAAATVASAQDAQKPLLNSWLDKAKSYVGTGIPSPSEAGAAGVASFAVTDLTTSNWRSTFQHRLDEPSPQNWLVYVTGGNKTCAGRCEELDKNFNKTAALLSATPKGPHLARLNCENQPQLCSIFFTGPPVLWYVQVPGPSAADQTQAPTNIYVKGLNSTAGFETTTQEMVDVHSKQTYLEKAPVEGWMHPFDGQLAKLGLNVPAGYFLWGMSVVPSWGVMLLVSFVTRNMMGKRMAGQAGGPRPAAAPAAAAKKSN